MATRQLPTGTVTFVFTDIEGSTALLDRLGDAYGDVLSSHHALLRDVWEAHGGIEVSTDGDAFFVAFSSASSAVAATAEAQAALAKNAWPHGERLLVRMGVHTGEPRIRDGDYWGPRRPLRRAARVGRARRAGTRFVGDRSARPRGGAEFAWPPSSEGLSLPARAVRARTRPASGAEDARAAADEPAKRPVATYRPRR